MNLAAKVLLHERLLSVECFPLQLLHQTTVRAATEEGFRHGESVACTPSKRDLFKIALTGGPDGTRTRDLWRDRPAF